MIAYLGRPAAREARARLRAARRVVASPRPAHGLNRDLFPRDEFLTPSDMATGRHRAGRVGGPVGAHHWSLSVAGDAHETVGEAVASGLVDQLTGRAHGPATPEDLATMRSVIGTFEVVAAGA